MKVWVIMGNDYPSDVMDSAEKADAHCKQKMEEQKCNCGKGDMVFNGHAHTCPRSQGRGTIYYRNYEFEVK